MDYATCEMQLRRLAALAREAGVVDVARESAATPSRALAFARVLILELDEAGASSRMKEDPAGARAFAAMALCVTEQMRAGALTWEETGATEETTPFYWLAGAVIEFCEGLHARHPGKWE
jgi:hypothetical protein